MSLELSERKEIEQLLSETFAWIDHGEADRLPKVCAYWFALHAPGIDLDLAQFEQRMIVRVAASYVTRHQWSNLRVLDVDGDAVEVAYVVCVHRRDEGSDVTTRSIADFADRWVRTSDGWRLASRTMTPALDKPSA
jgi:3-phenylpropionate/cinnamic acid dioxygenase small subunit